VQQARARMLLRLSALVNGEIERVTALRSRPVLADPEALVQPRAEDLVRLVDRGTHLVQLCVERAETHVHRLASQLQALSPQRTLDRGYALVHTAEGLVRDPAQVTPGAALRIRVARGELAATAE